jgi:carbamoylphosphate synthase small subunit
MKVLDVSRKYGFSCLGFFNKPEVVKHYGFEGIKKGVNECDIVCFGGGEDVGTSIYGHQPIPGQEKEASDRDYLEIAYFKEAVRQGKPILGICRGSQLVTCLSGGALIQHVVGHGDGHNLICYDDDVHYITSTHHQMIYLENMDKQDYQLLAWTRGLSHIYARDTKQAKKEPSLEPEVVYYPKCKAFAVQGHPEYLGPKHDVSLWLHSEMQKRFNLNVEF